MPAHVTAIMTIVCACLAGSAAPAAAREAASVDRSKYMTVDQIRRGMKGVGRTVMHGTELTEFQAEVVDVIRNWGPKQDVILVRCSGANLEHSGIIRGMSGSPIYLPDPEDGGKMKMIGAIAYGWTWNKDPVGGVQPIAQMLHIRGYQGKPDDAKGSSSNNAGSTATPLRQLPGPVRPDAASRYDMMGFRAPLLDQARYPTSAEPVSGQLAPLSTPLAVGSSCEHVVTYVRQFIAGRGLDIVRAGGGAGGQAERAPDNLVAGGSLVVPFILGDLDMAGVGTVTEVIGDRVLGFGHSMMAEGTIELPMATGWVHTPISMLTASFKLASTGRIVGTLRGDTEVGVWGVSGKAPKMIPMSVTVRRSDEQQDYRYRVMHHHRMTPWIVGSGLMQSLMANRDLPETHTLRYRLNVQYDKLGAFSVSNLSSMRRTFDLAGDLTEPMSMLLDNEFGRGRVTKIDADITVEDKATLMTIERADLLRSTLKPGETIEVAIRWRPYRAKPFVRHYTLPVPKDVENGTYPLLIGGARTHLLALRMNKPHLFRTDSLPELMAAMRQIGSIRSDRLYMSLQVKRGGLAMGRTEMPELPSHRKHILGQAGLQDTQEYREPLSAAHAVPFVVNGSRQFAVTIDRRADQ